MTGYETVHNPYFPTVHGKWTCTGSVDATGNWVGATSDPVNGTPNPRPTMTRKVDAMKDPTGWTIDPETLRFSENDARPDPHGYTWAEFAAMNRPPCPACGTPVHVDAVPTPDRGPGELRYIVRGWRCPRGCH